MGSFGLIHKVKDLQDANSIPLVAKISYNDDMLYNEIQALQMVNEFAESQDEFQHVAKSIP